MKKRILITGATGNLGAYFLRNVLSQENTRAYAIVRSRNGSQYALKRLIRNQNAFGKLDIMRYAKEGRIHVLCADFTKIDELKRINISEKLDEIWHFASSLKYMPRDRDEIYRVNVDGLKNMIRLHQRLCKKNSIFHYISTAYVIGKNWGTLSEKVTPIKDNMLFNNEYERSKLIAENIVNEAFQKGQIKLNIYRPSIVVGDKSKGQLVHYNGYYLGLRSLIELKKHLVKANSKPEVIHIRGDGNATLNVIPLDDAIGLIRSIAAKSPAQGNVYNIVNGTELTLEIVYQTISLAIGLNLKLVDKEKFRKSLKTVYERLVSYGMTYIMPYVNNQGVRFEMSASEKLLGKKYTLDLSKGIFEHITRIYSNSCLK